MIVRQPRYSKEEFARRGDEIYEHDVRPKVCATGPRKVRRDRHRIAANGKWTPTKWRPMNDCLVVFPTRKSGRLASAWATSIVSAAASGGRRD